VHAVSLVRKLLRLDDSSTRPILRVARGRRPVRAKNVSVIPADFSLVRDTRQPTRSGKNASNGSSGSLRGGTVIDQNDFIAGKRQFVASARRGSVACSDKFQSGVGAESSIPSAFRW